MTIPRAIKCAKCGKVARVLYKYEGASASDRTSDGLIHLMISCAKCGMRLQEFAPPAAG